MPDSDAVGAAGRPGAAISRFQLPDEWSGKGACPLCGAPGQLRVRHQVDLPDQMVCAACGTAFEVEVGGSRIRMVVAPAALAGAAGLLDTWLTPAELRTRIDQATPAPPHSPFEQSDSSPPAAGAATARTVPTDSKAATGPLMPKSTNGADEAEPKAEDWLASLAAVIGGLSPAAPPPDAVLADELERALLARPEPGANGEAGQAENRPTDGPAAVTVARLASAATPANSPESPTSVAAGPVPLDDSAALATGTSLPAVSDVLPAVSAVPGGPPTLISKLAKNSAETLVATKPIAFESRARLTGAPTPAMPAPIASASVRPLPATVPVAAPSQAGPGRHELAERAWKLHELGNSLASIQGALESSGGTPEDIAPIMARLVALEQARRARFFHSLEITLGIALFALLVLVVIGVVVIRLPTLGVSANPAVTPAGSAAPATVPAPAATLFPGGAAGSGTPAASPTAVLGYNPLIGLLNRLLPGNVKIPNGPSPTPTPPS